MSVNATEQTPETPETPTIPETKPEQPEAPKTYTSEQVQEIVKQRLAQVKAAAQNDAENETKTLTERLTALEEELKSERAAKLDALISAAVQDTIDPEVAALALKATLGDATDAETIKAKAAELLEQKPHLKKTTEPPAPNTQGAPGAGGGGNDGDKPNSEFMTAEEFKKVTPAQLAKDPELKRRYKNTLYGKDMS